MDHRPLGLAYQRTALPAARIYIHQPSRVIIMSWQMLVYSFVIFPAFDLCSSWFLRRRIKTIGVALLSLYRERV